MAKLREIPDLSNETPDSLVEKIKDWREKQSDAKFYIGVYRERLEAIRDTSTSAITAPGQNAPSAQFVDIDQEYIDVEAVRARWTRAELLEWGILKSRTVRQLRTS